jgi:hypothetical protein
MGTRGGRRSTTWGKGTNPVPKKGYKQKRTILKEQLGLQNWEGLKQYIEGDGATKLIKEMQKLNGKDFIVAMHNLSEYVRPKLRRVDGNLNANISFKDKKIIFK